MPVMCVVRILPCDIAELSPFCRPMMKHSSTMIRASSSWNCMPHTTSRSGCAVPARRRRWPHPTAWA